LGVFVVVVVSNAVDGTRPPSAARLGVAQLLLQLLDFGLQLLFLLSELFEPDI
jgi:hypothetical protein